MLAPQFQPLNPIHIALLAGGESAEREISLKSGAAVAGALRDRGHAITVIDPREVALSSLRWERFDAAFIALHGTYGEDGRVQCLLEDAGIAFTGSNADTSRLAFSKSASKERFAQHYVPTPHYLLIHESDDATRIRQQAEKVGYPLVVKPDAQGSSLGVSIIDSPRDLPRALTACFQYDAFGLLEKAIAGTEWTVALLDELVMPSLRIEPGRQYFDYEAKYQDPQTTYHFETDLPTNVVTAIENAGRRAAEVLGTRGLARVDIRLDEFHQPWVLEVNTVPGLTEHSLVPKAAARIGICFGELCERAIASCLYGAGQPSRSP